MKRFVFFLTSSFLSLPVFSSEAPDTANVKAKVTAVAEAEPEKAKIAPRDIMKRVHFPAASNQFGFKAFQNFVASEEEARNPNKLFSPISLTFAYQLLQMGAQGETLLAMTDAFSWLSFQDTEAKASMLDRGAKLLLSRLTDEQTEGVELQFANSVWNDSKDSSFHPAYLKKVSSLRASAAALNFSEPSAASTINSWVSDNTKGKITEIVDSGTLRSQDFMLINTTYFKGKWLVPFKGGTED